MELTVQNVYGLLLRSKLLSLDEARVRRRVQYVEHHPAHAASAAFCEMLEAQVTTYPCSTSAARITASSPASQPIRQPVIRIDFDSPLTTIVRG